jgi:hypothetical protein
MDGAGAGVPCALREKHVKGMRVMTKEGCPSHKHGRVSPPPSTTDISLLPPFDREGAAAGRQRTSRIDPISCGRGAATTAPLLMLSDQRYAH